MELDFNLLQDKIKTKQREMRFYTDGIELVNHLQFNRFLEGIEIEDKFPFMSTDFLDAISQGKMPSEDIINETSVDDLDSFIQESLYLSGMCIGILALSRSGDFYSEYIKFLMEAQKREELRLTARGFAALTLSMDAPPSSLILIRMFPPSTDEAKIQESVDIIAELNGECVRKFGAFNNI